VKGSSLPSVSVVVPARDARRRCLKRSRPCVAKPTPPTFRPNREASAGPCSSAAGPARPAPYPYGDLDPAIAHLIGGAGYLYGVTCVDAPATFEDSPLQLPRIEVAGSDVIADFIAKV
jgi:hypothetical protein